MQENREEPPIVIPHHNTSTIGLSMHTSSLSTLSSDDPDSDEVVGESSKEGLTISGPSEGGTLWLLGLVGEIGREVWLEVIDNGSISVSDCERVGGNIEVG